MNTWEKTLLILLYLFAAHHGNWTKKVANQKKWESETVGFNYLSHSVLPLRVKTKVRWTLKFAVVFSGICEAEQVELVKPEWWNCYS